MGNEMKQWIYGIRVHEEDGDFVVEVRDLPEVVTSGDSYEEALELAADAIEVVVANRMEKDRGLSEPSSIQNGEIGIPLSAQLAAKASIYVAWKASGLKKTELAKLLHRNEVEVRRILDPHHGTKLDQLEEAAKALGGRLIVQYEAA